MKNLMLLVPLLPIVFAAPFMYSRPAYADDASNTPDYSITGMPNNVSGTDTAPIAIGFTVDLGNPNSNGGEDPAANVTSQTYTISTDNSGAFSQNSIKMPSNFTVSSFSANSFTIIANGPNTSATFDVSVNVVYNMQNMTSPGQEIVTMSGSATFSDNSSKQATPGTVTVTINPVYNYDYNDMKGKPLWSYFNTKSSCTPAYDTSGPTNGVLLVSPGETVRIGIGPLVDDDRKKVGANGSWQLDDNPNSLYQLTYSTSTGATFTTGRTTFSSIVDQP